MSAPHLAAVDWTQDHRAAFLLGTMRACSPQTRAIPPVDRWSVASDEYCGPRVDALDAIYGEYLLPLIPTRENPVTDWTAFDAFMAQPRVQEAIDAVLNPPVEAEVFDLLTEGMRAQRPVLARDMARAA